MIEDKQCPNCQRKYGYWKWSLWPRRKPFPCKSCGYSIRFDIKHSYLVTTIVVLLGCGVWPLLYSLAEWPVWVAFWTVYFAFAHYFHTRQWNAGWLFLVDEAGLPLDPNHEIKSV